MINLYVYGNCQSQPISRIIDRLTPKEINVTYPIKPVHLLDETDKQRLYETLSKTDVFIYQNVMSQKYSWRCTDEILKVLPNNVKLLRFPSLYFDAYFDETITINHKNLNKFIPYHNRIILDCYLSGLSKNDTLDKFINNNPIRFDDSSYQKSLTSIKERERNSDIIISDYIEDHFKKHRLFWTVNHPSNSLLLEVSKRIINEIYDFQQLPNIRFIREFLGDTSIPLSNNYLTIAEHVDNRISIRKNIISLYEYIESFFDIYEKNKALLFDLNL